jgi:hypothetical protein
MDLDVAEAQLEESFAGESDAGNGDGRQEPSHRRGGQQRQLGKSRESNIRHHAIL